MFKNAKAAVHFTPLQSLPEPPFADFVADALYQLPDEPEAKIIQGRVYDFRRALIRHMEEHLTAKAQIDDMEAEHAHEERMDLLRSALPPLTVDTIRSSTKFSPLRTGLLAILGLLCGAAMGQAILYAESLGFGLSFVSICSVAGVVFTLWAAEKCAWKADDALVATPFGPKSWGKIRRYAFWFWCIVLILQLAQDFLGARSGILHFMQALGLFLRSGSLLALFSNVYGLLALTLAFALLLKKPAHFDKYEFADKLLLAAKHWWAGSSLAASLLIENADLKKQHKPDTIQSVGSDLYSLAHELPQSKKIWMEERLVRLGFEAPHQDGCLAWSEAMQDTYTPLGHIEVGQHCFVDEPPLFEDGILVRKGSVRKVRK